MRRVPCAMGARLCGAMCAAFFTASTSSIICEHPYKSAINCTAIFYLQPNCFYQIICLSACAVCHNCASMKIYRFHTWYNRNNPSGYMTRNIHIASPVHRSFSLFLPLSELPHPNPAVNKTSSPRLAAFHMTCTHHNGP